MATHNPLLTSQAPPASLASVQLLPANPKRSMAVLFNDSSATAYVAFSPIASTTVYTVQLAANEYFELPLAVINGQSGVYTGQISCVWSSAVGAMRITELS